MSDLQDLRLKKEMEKGPIGCLENAIKDAQFSLDRAHDQLSAANALLCESATSIKTEVQL